MEKISGYKAIKRMAQEKPELLPVVRICLDMAKKTDNDFAGAWVFNRLKVEGIKMSNLRPLASYGVIEKTGNARGGTRAYYLMPDPDGVKQALRKLQKRS